MSYDFAYLGALLKKMTAVYTLAAKTTDPQLFFWLFDEMENPGKKKSFS